MITEYRVKDIGDFNKFLSKLYGGLLYYRKRNPDMIFKLSWSKGVITLKTSQRIGSCN